MRKYQSSRQYKQQHQQLVPATAYAIIEKKNPLLAGTWNMRLLLLTLEKHKEGIWITRLIKEFERISVDVVVTVHVVAIERIVHQVVLVDAATETVTHSSDTDAVPFLQQYDGIVNRVSDAADPILLKRCIAILTVAKYILHQPVFNGPTAYSVCSNKWCHHVLFTMAQLNSPSTAIIDVPCLKTTAPGSTTESIRDLSQQLLPNDPLPHLIKPNAGGFGNGIVKIEDNDSISTKIIVPSVNDDTLLLQAYHHTSNNTDDGTHTVILYRVWFLLGKVQCAVQRTITTTPNALHKDSKYSSNDEFTSGCSASHSTGGGTCEYPHRTKSTLGSSTDTAALFTASPSFSSSSTTTTTTTQPWTVPDEVRVEIEDRLLPLLQDDGHAGSVEFLLHIDRQSNEHQRYYFDLNLLSTLPIMDDPNDINGTASAGSEDAVWDISYNPWSELAHGIISVMRQRTT